MASEARPPIDIAANNWAQRIDSLVNAGVSKKTITSKIKPIMDDDLRRVASGSQAMPEDAAVLAGRAALTGRPALPKAEDQSWSPDDLFGDVTKDITGLTWGAIPGLARWTFDLPKNVQLTAEAFSKGHSKADNKWLVEHGFEPNTGMTTDPSAWASALRNVARTPILGIIPGIHTAAGLTTAKGRSELLHHPVSTALDVAPVVGTIGKAGGIARAAAGAEAAEAGSAAEAFLSGHPIKAAYRAGVPEAAREAIATKTVAGLRKVGLDPQSFGMARGLDIEHRRTRVAFEKALADNPIIEDIAKLPDEERTLLAQEAAYPDQHPSPSVEHSRLLERIQAFNDRLVDENPNLTVIERTHEVPRPEVKQYEPDFSIPEGLPEDARFVVRDAKGRMAHHENDIMPLTEEGVISARSAYESAQGRKPGVRVNIESGPYQPTPDDIAANERMAALDAQMEAMRPTDQPKEGFTRLYRAEREGATNVIDPETGAQGQVFFADTPEGAAQYGGKLSYIDVPNEVAEASRSNAVFDLSDDTGKAAGQHYTLPRDAVEGNLRPMRETDEGFRPAMSEEDIAQQRAMMDEIKRLKNEVAGREKGHQPTVYREGKFEPTEPIWREPIHNPDINEARYVLRDGEGNIRLRTGSTEDIQKWVNDMAYKGEQADVQVELPREPVERFGERRTGERAAQGRRATDKARAENLARQQELLERYDSATTDAERIAIMDEAKALHEQTRFSHQPPAATQTRTTRYVYPTDSEVARAHRAMLKAEEKVGTVETTARQRIKEETITQTQRDMQNLDKHTQRVARAQKRVESAQAAVARAQASAEGGRGQVRTLENAITRLEKAMDNLEVRRAAAEEAGAKVKNTTNRSIEAQQRKISRVQENAAQKAAVFEETFSKNPPANMVPILERIVRNKVENLVNAQPWPVLPDGSPAPMGEVTAADFIDDATRQIERHDMANLLTPEEYADIRREVMRTWQDVADQGYHPVWTHNVEVERAGYAPTTKPLPTRNARVSQVKERVGDLTPHVEDIAVSMSHALVEHIRDVATKRYLADFVQPHTRTWSEIADELHRTVDVLRAKNKIPRGLDDAGALQYVLNKDWVEWNPEAIFETQKPKLTGTATVGDTKTYLPRNIAKIADDLIQGPSQSGIAKGARSVNKLYKTSIMAFSLKHMAHILFGGTVFTALRGGIEEAMKLPEAIRMVKAGEMPLELSRHLDIETPDQLFQYAAGNKLGQMYAKSLGGVAKAKMKFDEFVSNVQRTTAYLGEEARGLKKGLDPAEAKELGLRHAYKTLVDIDGMNPLERNVLRQVMPFYAFMRHTLRYILTYPIDHPLRAAILSRISDIEQKDWHSGLPEAFQSLFFLGQPDAHGNITGIEMRQFNPFRDTGSYFTLAGFLKSVHPALQIPASMMGIDKFTGAPELYPEVEYDPMTGNLVAKRPKNAPWNAITTLIPEAGLLDYFGGVTKDMRELKERDPEAFKRRLYQMLFIPFEPKEINVPQEQADQQSALLAIAQQDVSNAMRTGDTSAINRYPVVPYQGELVQPEQLTNVINYLRQIRPDVAPRSAIPSVKLSNL